MTSQLELLELDVQMQSGLSRQSQTAFSSLPVLDTGSRFQRLGKPRANQITMDFPVPKARPSISPFAVAGKNTPSGWPYSCQATRSKLADGSATPQ